MELAAISALLLSGIMFTVARHEAEYSLLRALEVSCGLVFCGVVALRIMGVYAIPLMLGLTVWALHQFCYLRWKMAALVTGIYLVCMTVVGFAVRSLLKT